MARRARAGRRRGPGVSVRILQGDALAMLRTLPDKSVQCVVTSPPYLNLRSYLPADHPDKAKEIGLHDTADDYVDAMVAVFREVHRVLRDDGVCFINLGDSYAGSGKGPTGTNGLGDQGVRQGFVNAGAVRSDVTKHLDRLVKGQTIFVGHAASIRVTPHRGNVAKPDQPSPEGVLFSLLGVERVTIKQRDQDFCQVLNTLGTPGYCRVDAPAVFCSVNGPDAEIVLDAVDGIRIIVSDLESDREAVLAVLRPSSVRASEDGEGAFAIEEPREPRAKVLRSGQSIGNPVAFDAPLERFPDVNLVQEAVPLSDGFDASAGDRRHVRVRQAAREQVRLGLVSGVEIEFRGVRHLYFSNPFGSLVRYQELYDKAIRKANASRPKTLLGVPDMVKRALMEDGWICRSAVVWAKKSAMPESVRDRPTSAWEPIWMFTKSPRYYWDQDAVREPLAESSVARLAQPYNQAASGYRAVNGAPDGDRSHLLERGANIRNVWHLGPEPSRDAHFASYPTEIPRRCILAATRKGDTVLDPFLGSGTTALVADRLERNAIGIELSPQYAAMARRRIEGDAPLFADVEVAS